MTGLIGGGGGAAFTRERTAAWPAPDHLPLVHGPLSPASPGARVARHSQETPHAMKAREKFDPQEALVCTMVLVAAAENGITDREIGAMASLVQTLPVFENFSTEQLRHAADATVALLGESEGLAHAFRLIRESLPPRLRETAYALALDVVASDRSAGQPILRMLELTAAELELDKLVVAALERAARARFRLLTPRA